jgi:hypothetical protein
VNKQLQFYRIFLYPPKIYRFETVKCPIKPLEIAEFEDTENGLSGKLVVMNVSHELIASENSWKTTIEGEFYGGY